MLEKTARSDLAFSGVKWRWGHGLGRCFAGVSILQPNPTFERDWPIYIRFAACGNLNFWAPAKFRDGQPLNLNVRGGRHRVLFVGCS